MLEQMSPNVFYKGVVRCKPTTSTKQCTIKFHKLRNQFYIENAKVISSFKSGAGTDDVSIIYTYDYCCGTYFQFVLINLINNVEHTQ